MKRKTLKKRSEKAVAKIMENKKEQDMLNRFFAAIWESMRSEHRNCQSCGKWLGPEMRSYFFDHLVEKSRYPKYKFDKENIFMCCFECHSKKTAGFPTEKHQQAITHFKNKIRA